MLPLYLGALTFGGILLLATMFLGGGDSDTDHAADHDHGADAGHAHGHGDVMGWLPVTSLRFWTYFLGFGGLAGTVLTYLGGTSRLVVGLIALGVGWASGAGMMFAMRAAQKSGAGSELDPKDLRGETAEVIVPIGQGQVGKVRVEAKGRIFDLIAETDETQTFATGSKVMIVGEGEDGRVQVASA